MNDGYIVVNTCICTSTPSSCFTFLRIFGVRLLGLDRLMGGRSRTAPLYLYLGELDGALYTRCTAVVTQIAHFRPSATQTALNEVTPVLWRPETRNKRRCCCCYISLLLLLVPCFCLLLQKRVRKRYILLSIVFYTYSKTKEVCDGPAINRPVAESPVRTDENTAGRHSNDRTPTVPALR